MNFIQQKRESMLILGYDHFESLIPQFIQNP